MDEDGKTRYGGASTIISRAKSQYREDRYPGQKSIDPETGKLKWADWKKPETYIDEKGRVQTRHIQTTKMAATDDAMTLVSDAKTAVELYRDRAHTLPIKLTKESKVLHVIITELDYPSDAAPDLTRRLEEICGKVDVIGDPRPWITKEAVKTGGYDYVFVTAGVFPSYGLNSVKLVGEVARNMMEGWTRYGVPCIFVCHGDPYFGEQFKGLCDTVINTYGYNKYTNERVIEIVTGK